MLLDLPTHLPTDPILTILADGEEITRVAKGIYLGPLNSQLRFEHLIKDEWPDFEVQDGSVADCPYGVCDYPGQVLVHAPQLMDSERKFVLLHTRVWKFDQPSSGGWRWHKWGPYIGVFEPTTEYLYDEPEIEEVFGYHVYEMKG